ncbi:MAG: uracil-DNA glycosylase [Acidobacteriota bacterium]
MCKKIQRVSRELAEGLAALARRIEEQLRFYRDIGLADIGGSATKQAPTADLAAEAEFAAPETVEPQLPQQTDEEMAKKKSDVEQVSLFGDLMPEKPASSVALPVLPADASLEDIRRDVGECTRCKLHEHRSHIVFGEGNPQARLVFVGEGPGADEDATGRPFVGRAGQLLDKIIAAIGMKREDVYIANVVMCRPPGNRTPERDEVATCEPFLFRKLALIRPKVIVALGSPAFQCLMRSKETISKSRGEWREWNGIRVMPTFHPAYLLRSPEKKREVWEDMKKVRDYLNSSETV